MSGGSSAKQASALFKGLAQKIQKVIASTLNSKAADKVIVPSLTNTVVQELSENPTTLREMVANKEIAKNPSLNV